MKLEEIAKTFGFVDYYDNYSGYIYHLSMAEDNGDGKLKIPVSLNGQLIGYSSMDKVETTS